MHVREQIRSAVVARLRGHVDGVADRVVATRIHPFGSAPAIAVFTTDERSEIARQGDEEKAYRRAVQVAVDLLAHEDGADGALDQMAAQVESLLDADDTLGGLLRNLSLASTADVYSGEGERMAGRKRLIFEAVYMTVAGKAETALPGR